MGSYKCKVKEGHYDGQKIKEETIHGFEIP